MNSTQALERARQVIRRQHKTLSTEHTYLYWLRKYIAGVQSMPDVLASEQKLERFLTDLALCENVSASTQNQAFNAILFFYRDVLGKPLANVDALRATRPDRVRRSPTVQETQALLAEVKNESGYPTNLIARLLYGCGLRVSEPLNLRVKDLEFDTSRLFIVGGKGRKDRVVALPCCLIEELRGQLDFARRSGSVMAPPRFHWPCPINWLRNIPNTGSPGDGRGFSRRTGRVAIRARVKWSVIGCTKRMCSGPSSGLGGTWASWSCRTSCDMPMPRIV